MTTVLVTGVGGGVGQSIIKSLEGGPYAVVGADGEPAAAGLYAVATAYRIPYASKPAYVASLLDICRREDCRVVFPGLDAELPVLSQARAEFRAAGITLVVSDPRVVAIADDKLETARFLTENRLPAPATVALEEALASGLDSLRYPLILKPRRGGARSRGVFQVPTASVLQQLLDRIEAANYVAQEQIHGDEYTCGSLTINGSCRGVIVMQRILRDGDTHKAFVVHDPNIESHVRAAANALQPFGPCNFQLRVRDGIPYIFEINARCSGTTYCRTLAGFNEPLMMLNWLINAQEPVYDVREISILRYWNELVVPNREVEQMRTRGTRKGQARRLGSR